MIVKEIATLALALVLALSACGHGDGSASAPTGGSGGETAGTSTSSSGGAGESQNPGGAGQAAGEQTPPEASSGAGDSQSAPEGSGTTTQEEETEMQLTIGGNAVEVQWENNESVKALRDLCANAPLTIQLSMYGGFEQVGAIGTDLPRKDSQTSTRSGDIVLYQGNQIVIFYGSNSWAYTRLGHITDRTQQQMADLLGHGDVSITLAGSAS